MKTAYLLVPFAPLVGAMVAGFAGRAIGKKATHRVAILGVLVSLLASLWVMHDVSQGNTFNGALYSWAVIGKLKMEVGFLIDQLTAMMMVVVTFVSLMVHVYTIGYMEEDDGYQRFFAYISLFTFSMLMLVMSNNLLQLFFGWEAVGLVSYLLIGFWYTKPSAIYANLKAFMVNRVGDFGFVLGIGLLVAWTGSLDYAEIFAAAPNLEKVTIQLIGDTPWSLITVTCICLFVGAMGKSAQFPLHVWLPDSMEGPTPISALIHAATMVTSASTGETMAPSSGSTPRPSPTALEEKTGSGTSARSMTFPVTGEAIGTSRSVAGWDMRGSFRSVVLAAGSGRSRASGVRYSGADKRRLSEGGCCQEWIRNGVGYGLWVVRRSGEGIVASPLSE